MQNRLRKILKEGRTTYGLWVTIESPTITEIAVTLGLDWVCVDMEHGHLDYREVMEHLRVARGSETSVIVRVPEIQLSAVKRTLDMGAQGLILPYVESREDLETGMRFGRYPPQGIRGIGGDRAFRWGLGMQEYIASANEETLILPLIETRSAVENIEAILSVPGLEAIFFGPADMSASYGYAGQWEGPGVAEHILRIRALAESRGIASGVLARSTPESLTRRDQGFRLIALGQDMPLLIRALRENLEQLGQKIEPRL